jgi:hypothetical protein
MCCWLFVPLWSRAAGVGQLLVCSRKFGPRAPLLYVAVLQSGVAHARVAPVSKPVAPG